MKLNAHVVKEEARRLGFDLVGVTVPLPLDSFPIYEHWLAEGCHGEMTYLATERSRYMRADPRHILPEAQSVLMMGVQYPSNSLFLPYSVSSVDEGRVGLNKNRLEGKIASYALGRDYHDVLLPQLEKLAEAIEKWSNQRIPHRCYTDTGAVLERGLAQRAGLGWIGRNGCLIHPGAGSYYLLAEIFSSVELAIDEPFTADRCGSCSRCIQVCPTGCIRVDRTVDARRCIAYLTIELKGIIPVPLRPLMKDWVFGCDLCQQVCPWNTRFAGDVVEGCVNLIEEMMITPQMFNIKYKGTAVWRAKRRGYLRNVAISLGNAGDAIAVPVLAEVLMREVEPLVRAHVAWALGIIGGTSARQVLIKARSSESELSVIREIEEALEITS